MLEGHNGLLAASGLCSYIILWLLKGVLISTVVRNMLTIDNIVNTGGIASLVFHLFSSSLLFHIYFTAWGPVTFAFYVHVICLCTWLTDMHLYLKWET